MSRHRIPPRRLVHHAAYREAFQRLDESLEQNTSVSNAEMLQLLGRHMFGDLWHDQEPSGTEVLPE
jgi:tetrahydromethanopterin S-methyltransferase subunit G